MTHRATWDAFKLDKENVIKALNLLKNDVEQMDPRELAHFIEWWDTMFIEVNKTQYLIIKEI